MLKNVAAIVFCALLMLIGANTSAVSAQAEVNSGSPASATAMAAGESGGESGLSCYWCVENTSTGYHAFYSVTCVNNGEPCRACGGTSQCHIDPQTGPCHVACQQGGGTAMVTRTLNEVRSATLVLSPQAGAKFLLDHLKSNPNMRLVAERGVVQVLGCKNTIVAQLKLPAQLVAQLRTQTAVIAVVP